MTDLKKDLKSSRRSAYAVGTLKNLKVQWEAYLMFCIFFGLQKLPSSSNTLSLFAQFLSRSFKAVQSIKNYISGVKTMHLLLGYPVAEINNFIVNLTITGIARQNPHCIKQALPITPDILLKMVKYLDFSLVSDRVYWCLFLFAFFLFARKSNLVPNIKKDIKEGKCLQRSNVHKKNGMLVVEIRWSKTIQFGERKLVVPLIPIPGSVLCPVMAYRNMCEKVRVIDTKPLFSLSRNNYITYSKFQIKMRQLIEKIGLDPEVFSTHSFRRGGATFAFKSGVSSELIQLHGDWKSDAYKNYLTFDLEDKLQVAEKMKENILRNV